jgi:hypothetical protein
MKKADEGIRRATAWGRWFFAVLKLLSVFISVNLWLVCFSPATLS